MRPKFSHSAQEETQAMGDARDNAKKKKAMEKKGAKGKPAATPAAAAKSPAPTKK